MIRPTHCVFCVSAALAAQLFAAAAFAQVPADAQQNLTAAASALQGLDSSTLTGDIGTSVAAVQRDFQAMQAAVKSSTPGQSDWRANYADVERDLASLIGPVSTQPGAQPPANLPQLDPTTREALQNFRLNLELFNASMLSQMAPGRSPSAAPASVGTQPATATQSPTGTGQSSTASTQPAAAQPPAAQPPTTVAPPAAQPPSGQTPTVPPPAGQPPSVTPQQSGTTAPQPTPSTQTVPDTDAASALIDRMETIVSAALGGKPAPKDAKPVGTTGVLPGVDAKSGAGRVVVDRAALDELLAELQQLNTMLKVRQP
jgi:hypothetical protein